MLVLTHISTPKLGSCTHTHTRAGNAMIDIFFFDEHMWQAVYAISCAVLLSVCSVCTHTHVHECACVRVRACVRACVVWCGNRAPSL